ncbi:MAG: cell division protein ZapE, partial [Pseudarthrobacter sp.]|nr:cell division protein ZapE [Pseudarthrobacter sp.]
MVQIEQLAARTPAVSVDELLNGFYPSPRFGEVSFASYRPDPKQPSQAAAVHALKGFADGVGSGSGGGLFKKLFGKKDASRAGIYLDGGFGVG